MKSVKWMNKKARRILRSLEDSTPSELERAESKLKALNEQALAFSRSELGELVGCTADCRISKCACPEYGVCELGKQIGSQSDSWYDMCDDARYYDVIGVFDYIYCYVEMYFDGKRRRARQWTTAVRAVRQHQHWRGGQS